LDKPDDRDDLHVILAKHDTQSVIFNYCERVVQFFYTKMEYYERASRDEQFEYNLIQFLRTTNGAVRARSSVPFQLLEIYIYSQKEKKIKE
jgi:hypothetical protein